MNPIELSGLSWRRLAALASLSPAKTSTTTPTGATRSRCGRSAKGTYKLGFVETSPTLTPTPDLTLAWRLNAGSLDNQIGQICMTLSG